MNVVCYERGLSRAGLLGMWNGMNVVCNEHAL